MENPFLKNGYLGLNASINKLYIAEMPTAHSEMNYEGKRAFELFSTSLFIDEIKKNYIGLQLDLSNVEEKYLPQYLDQCLASKNEDIRIKAEEIVGEFGKRLGVIFLVLKKGQKKNRLARADWNDDCWDYWAQIDNIILCGGLASSNIGHILKKQIERVFEEEKEQCYNIVLIDNSANIAAEGCASFIQYKDIENTYLILDCGQSFIKRNLVTIKSGKIIKLKELSKVLAKHVKWEYVDVINEKKEAVELNNYLLSIIQNTINESNLQLGREIVISIANYINCGQIANRGGYGKLRLLSENYERYLADQLSERYKTKIDIKLVHDGTAMAAAFNKYKNAVCISLGTAFGVGFPNALGKKI